MTTHEVLTALIWLVAGGYFAYLAWFFTRPIWRRKSMHRHPSMRDSAINKSAESP
jgi:hypothetical protein